MNLVEIKKANKENSFFFDFLKNIIFLAITSAVVYIGASGLDNFIGYYKEISAPVWLSFILSTACLTLAKSFLNRGAKLKALSAIAISSILPLLAILFGTNAHMDLVMIFEFLFIYFPINMGALGLIRTIGDLIG
jgi:hypothetical protein